jgi:hypothetical protein
VAPPSLLAGHTILTAVEGSTVKAFVPSVVCVTKADPFSATTARHRPQAHQMKFIRAWAGVPTLRDVRLADQDQLKSWL